VEFIDQSLPEVLPDGRRSPSDANILSVGGLASTFKRDVNPLRNEMKSRAARHHEWRSRMMREDENLRMINRVLPPPSSPALVRPGAAYGPEHISAQNPGADIVEASRSKVVVDADFSVFVAKQFFLKRASSERPAVQGLATDSKRVLKALLRA